MFPGFSFELVEAVKLWLPCDLCIGEGFEGQDRVLYLP